jgi:O-antigen/teichoic acid export membrane protein
VRGGPDMSAPLSGRKLLSSTAIYTAGDFLTAAVSGFLLIPLYVHFMTPADYGLYSTVTVMSNMLGVFMGLGLSSAFARYFFIHREHAQEYAYLGSVWLFQTFFAGAVAAALALWGQPLWAAISPGIPFRPYCWYVLAGGALGFSALLLSLWLRVQERPAAFVAVQLAGTVVLIALIGLFVVMMHKGADGALIAAIGSSGFLAAMSLISLGRRVTWAITPEYVGPSLAFGGWMVIGTLSFFLLTKAQLFFLQRYSEMASVGVFNLGSQLGGILILFSNSFGKAWQPFVYSATTPERAAAAIAQASKPFVAVMLYGSLGIALLSNEILFVVAKPAYFGAAAIIRVVAIASFIYVLGHLTSTALLYMKQAGLVQVAVLVPAALNVLLNAALVPSFGMLGAALAMLVAVLAMTLLGFVLSQRVLRVQYEWKALYKIVGVGAAILTTEWLLLPQAVGAVATTLRVAMLVAGPLLLLPLGAFSAAEIRGAKALAVRTFRAVRPAFK